MASLTSEESAHSRLEAQTLAQFDALVDKGEIFWESTEEIKTEQDPFDVSGMRSLEQVQIPVH